MSDDIDWDALYDLVRREQYKSGRGCGCGWEECDYLALGYPLCPVCGDHHRVWPDCPGDET